MVVRISVQIRLQDVVDADAEQLWNADQIPAPQIHSVVSVSLRAKQLSTNISEALWIYTLILLCDFHLAEELGPFVGCALRGVLISHFVSPNL